MYRFNVYGSLYHIGTTTVAIGGQLVSGTWKWMSNGDAIDMSLANWGGGQPNGGEYCLVLYGGASWQDGGCSYKRPYACELQP